MLSLARNICALVAASALLTILAQSAASPAPAPASAASPSPSPSPSASPVERLAIASCLVTPFYSWADPTLRPQQTHYPAARVGDAFHVIGTGTITPGELNLVETTIDIFAPYGAGKHYWVPTACIT